MVTQGAMKNFCLPLSHHVIMINIFVQAIHAQTKENLQLTSCPVMSVWLQGFEVILSKK